jgi:hypothetical protein
MLKKVIKEVKQSYYNILIEISNNKVRTLWKFIRNVSGKTQRAEKISEMNLGAGNIENAKEMAYAFNKLFLFTGKQLITTGDGDSMILVEQVASEFKSSSSSIRATDCRISLFSIFRYVSELSDLNSMATYSPNVSKASGTLLIIKFNAWLRHSSSDEMVLPNFCLLFLGENA